jgi:hypothetical protein
MAEDVRRIEQAIQMLAKAVGSYTALLNSVDRSMIRDQGRQLDATVGLGRLHVVVVQRMRAVGLSPVLAQSGTASRVSEEWVRELTSALRGLVR